MNNTNPQIEQLRAIIQKYRSVITHGEEADFKCTTWNQDLAIVLRMSGINAIPFNNVSFLFKSRLGGDTRGHTITVIQFDQCWVAVDLTSVQVKELSAEKIWIADSLLELAESVNSDLPEFMKYAEGQEAEFAEAVGRSTKKDIEEKRYERFRETSGGSPER